MDPVPLGVYPDKPPHEASFLGYHSVGGSTAAKWAAGATKFGNDLNRLLPDWKDLLGGIL